MFPKSNRAMVTPPKGFRSQFLQISSRNLSEAVRGRDRRPGGWVSSIARRFAWIAFFSHLVFVAMVFSESRRTHASKSLFPDSATYIATARNLVDHGAFSREVRSPYFLEPYRTPGYPILVAAAISTTGNPAAVIFLAPVFAALLAYSLVSLTAELVPDPTACRVAGCLAAFFPNGLGLSSAVLTDFVHGCVFAAAVWMTVRTLRRLSVTGTIVAAALWICAQLIRPTLSIAVLVIAVFGLALARSRRQIVVILVLMLASLPAPLFLASKNFEAHGVFSPTLLGEETFAEYAIPRAEALATGGDPEELRRRTRAEDDVVAGRLPGRTSYSRLYEAQKEHAHAVLRRYPLWVALELSMESGRQAIAPWDYLVTAFAGRTFPIARALFAGLYLAFLALAFVGTFIVAQRRGRAVALLFWVLFAFWIATGCVSTFVGSRLRFPGDLVLIPLAAIGLSFLPDALRRPRPHGRTSVSAPP